jgi:hypothetical protein
MNNTKISNFVTSSLGHFLFAILTLFSLYFWQERTLILDAAFQSYLFISTGRPAIMVERFGAGLTHLLPLMGVYLGFSLKNVLILYSFSIVLFHYVLFFISKKLLKDNAIALAIVLFNVFLIGDAFFWMQNELLQGISLMFVMWGFFIKKQTLTDYHWWDYLMGVGLITTVIYYHPLIIFPIAYVWLFFFIDEKNRISKRLLFILLGLFILIFLSKYLLRQPNFYDRGMTSQYVKEFHFSINTLMQSKGLNMLKTHLLDSFNFLIPAYLWVNVFYFKNKNYLKIALFNAFFIAYFLLITQRYLDDTRWYSAECHYQPLAVFLIMPLIWDVLPSIRNKKAVLMGLILFVSIRLFFIFQTHKPYTERLNYITNLVNTPSVNQPKKVIINEKKIDKEKLMMTWGMPYESMQITALKSPDSTRIFVITDNEFEKEKELLNSKDSMVTFLMLPKIAFKDLPKNYYNLTDTSAYKLLPIK